MHLKFWKSKAPSLRSQLVRPEVELQYAYKERAWGRGGGVYTNGLLPAAKDNRRQPIVAKNISRAVNAYNFQISDIHGEGISARFQRVSYIECGKSVECEADITPSTYITQAMIPRLAESLDMQFEIFRLAESLDPFSEIEESHEQWRRRRRELRKKLGAHYEQQLPSADILIPFRIGYDDVSGRHFEDSYDLVWRPPTRELLVKKNG